MQNVKKLLDYVICGTDDCPLLMICGTGDDCSCIILTMQDARELLAELPGQIKEAEATRRWGVYGSGQIEEAEATA
jgi:hypothetical protein